MTTRTTPSSNGPRSDAHATAVLQRPKELALALALLENPVEPTRQPHVLVFTGPEGIGKSSLLKSLRQTVAESHPTALIVRHDFKVGTGRAPVSLLIELRRKVSIAAQKLGHKVSFLAFDLAACQYVRSTQGKDEAEKLETIFAALSDPAYRSYIVTAGKIANALTLEALDEWIEKSLRRALRSARKKEAFGSSSARPLLDSLFGMDDDELLTLLPKLFAADIYDYLESQSERAVLFCLDDYASLWGGVESQQMQPQRRQADELLRCFIEDDSGAVFAIADRSKDFWLDRAAQYQQAADETDNRYRIIELQPFLVDACQDFLVQNAMPAPLAQVVAEQSGGLPVWLSLALQQYQRLSSKGVSVKPSDLRRANRQTIDIVGDGLERDELQTLKHLASVLWFDSVLFSALISGDLATGYPATAMHDFVKLSFVEEVTNGGYAIHSTFREPLLRWLEDNDPKLLSHLEKARSRSNAQSWVFGPTLEMLQAHDAIFQGLRQLKAELLSAEQFEAKIVELFAGGNPANDLRGQVDALKSSILGIGSYVSDMGAINAAEAAGLAALGGAVGTPASPSSGGSNEEQLRKFAEFNKVHGTPGGSACTNNKNDAQVAPKTISGKPGD